MSETSCPSREEFLAYLAGTLPEDTREAVASHVSACPVCQATIESLREADNTRKTPAPGHAPRLENGELPGMSASDVAVRRQLGEYKLLEKLGEGGMGVVYKALHTGLERVVALKVLSGRRMQDDQAIARFKREMKAIGRLDHPHIVCAHDAREIDGTPVLVMEYVEGFDLGELVLRVGPLRVADACELIRQAASGLQYAHEHGLVHRDVKPSNLVLSGEGQVKVLDLGLARIQAPHTPGEEITSAGDAMGTPEYMAPEQVSDSHSVDIRADVYSLGCTLYKLLAGRPPFGHPEYHTAFDMMTAHVSRPPPPIRQFRADVPDTLAAILNRMLAKDPGERFPTPGEVADAMGRFSPRADLSALLASARAGLEPPPASSLAPPRPQALLSGGWRRYAWAIAVGLILVAVGVAVTFRIVASIGRDTQLPITHLAQPNVADGNRDGGFSRTGSKGSARGGAGPQAPLSGWIVLSWAPPGAGKTDLWLFRPDGSRRVQITHDPRSFDVHPAFSPDGRRVAFVRGAQGFWSWSVWISNADGGDPRELVSGRSRSERLVSPVWISNSRICYARDPKLDRSPDMEVRQIDIDGRESRLMFRFRESLSEGGGVVTDVSPDGRQLLLVAQHQGLWPTADVYVTDLKGTLLRTVWADQPDDRKDARAVWSADGKTIAWHHNFTGGSYAKPIYYGVGLSRLGPDGQWTSQLQPDRETSITPLAWSPDGRGLLCARLDISGSRATLLLVDDQFQPTRELFEIEADCWQPGDRDFGRFADWAILPDDMAPPTTD